MKRIELRTMFNALRELQSATGEELSAMLPSGLDKVKGMSQHASLDTLMIYYHEVDRLSDPSERYINYSG